MTNVKIKKRHGGESMGDEREYQIAHVTDLLQLTDRQVEAFAQELPAIVATMRGMTALAESVAGEMGVPNITVVPYVTWIDDRKQSISVRLKDEARVEGKGDPS